MSLDIRYILSYFLFHRKKIIFIFRAGEHKTIKEVGWKEGNKVVRIVLGDRKPSRVKAVQGAHAELTWCDG